MDEETAARGIYFDFEGFTSGTPALVGTLIDDAYTVTFLHPTFAPAAAHLDAPTATLEDLIATLGRKAAREDRRLFAYSIHEAEQVVRHVPHYAEDIADRFTNAHTVIRKWAHRNGHVLPRGERSLKAYYALFFEPYPQRFATLSVPARLRRIAAYCKKGRPWQDAPAREQEILHDLVAYNRLDCVATRALVLQTTRPVPVPSHKPFSR